MDYEIVRVEPILNYSPDRGVYKMYRIYFKVCGRINDWIDVTEEEFVNNTYIDKLKQLVEKYKELLKC